MAEPTTTMPAPQTATVNGIEMTYYEVGPRGVGTPVVLCHGFPELAFSWRHQLAALEAAGRWAIAPDQRGYGGTEAPDGVQAYDMDHLTGDLAGLLDHVGAAKGVFVGHDWGGLVVWRMPLLHGDRTAGIVGVNTPFLPRMPVDPIEAFRARFGDGMYIVQFQTPKTSEALFEADVEKTMRFFMRKPRPDASGDDAFSGDPSDTQSLALQKILERYDKSDDRGQFLSPEELAVFVRAFEAKGFEAPINWYRNFTRNWEREEGMAMHVPQPCLMIMAEKDVVLPPSLSDHMPAFVPDLERHIVMGSGHWTQQEKPEETSQVLIDWLDRRFPKP